MRFTCFKWMTTACMLVFLMEASFFCQNKKHALERTDSHAGDQWKAPDTGMLGHSKQDEMIRYGRNLIVHTALFFGPHGTISHSSNGMSCDNCHIDGGTRLWANNFSMVACTYPLYRNRSGKIESIEMRINDCFERSLNGAALADSAKEMVAMIAYIKWVGQGITK